MMAPFEYPVTKSRFWSTHSEDATSVSTPAQEGERPCS